MNKTLFVIAAVAALAACDQSDHTIVSGPGDPNAPEVNTVGVVLPPAIAASKTYRCKDNSLVYIDWFADNATANFRAGPADPPTALSAAVPGDALIAEGYSLKGTPTDNTIALTRPGKGAQSCHA